MQQVTLFNDVYEDEIEQLLQHYEMFCRYLNGNYSLLLSPLEFILNRKAGERFFKKTNDGLILYDKRHVYGFSGEEALKEIRSCHYSTYIPEGWRYKTKKEYVYDIEKITALSGKEFAQVRNKINKYKDQYEIQISEEITDAEKIYDIWIKTVGEKYFQIHDKRLHENIFKYWDKIKDKTILYYLKNKNETVGFILCEKTSKDFVYAMTGKVLPDHLHSSTLFQYLVIENLRRKNYRYMSDGGAGTKGLKTFKEKFNPLIIKTYEVEKYGENIRRFGKKQEDKGRNYF